METQFKGYFKDLLQKMWSEPNHGLGVNYGPYERTQHNIRGEKFEIHVRFESKLVDDHFNETIIGYGLKYKMEGDEIVGDFGEQEIRIECGRFIQAKDLQKLGTWMGKIAYGKVAK